jgi:hypothetical protein
MSEIIWTVKNIFNNITLSRKERAKEKSQRIRRENQMRY